MKVTKSAAALMIMLLLAGCSSGPTLGRVGTPSNGKNFSTNDSGKNKQLTYMVDGNMKDACDAQTKLITDQKYTISGSPMTEDMHTRVSFTDNSTDIVLMCTEQKEGETLVGTKVTMTLLELRK